jgi:type II secretory pathway component PulF
VNTPGSLVARADLYRRLGQYLSSGIPAEQALEGLHRSPPRAAHRPFLGRARDIIREGGSMADGFRAGGRLIPALDMTLIEASERSGRLDRCFSRLAESCQERAGQLRLGLLALLYPAAILHLAILLAPLPALVLSGNFIAYGRQVLVMLAPIYALAFGAGWVFMGRHGARWRAVADQLLSPLPVIGNARRSLALARLAENLDVLLAAGVNVLEAWPLAAAASGSSAIQRRVEKWRPLLEQGETPGELVERSREFPQLFASQYRTGELSGKLDESLAHLHKYYLEEGNRRMRLLARMLPFLIYLLVVLGIAIHIVRFWLNYYGGIFHELGL